MSHRIEIGDDSAVVSSEYGVVQLALVQESGTRVNSVATTTMLPREAYRLGLELLAHTKPAE